MAAQAEDNAAVADAGAEGSVITWQPKIKYSSIVLNVSTPDGDIISREFRAGADITFSISDENGQRRPEGHYHYQLRVVPVFAPGVREALAAARANGTGEQVARDFRKRGLIPREETVQSGAFMVSNGAFVLGPAAEETDTKGLGEAMDTRSANAAVEPKDQVINDDLILTFSACIGFDCVNGESFGFDTLRLKENNLRIHFDDTSNSASFPSRDWRLVANDTTNGGEEHFSVEDSTRGTTPFRIEGDTPNFALYVDNAHRIGNNTSTPVVEIHSVDGDTPTLRLEQNGSSGFTAQTWDVAGNETNFFIRDATNGSRLPFKIEPNAPTDSIVVLGTSGNVGLGIRQPEQRLHVFGNAVIQGNLEVRDDQFGRSIELKSEFKKVYELLQKKDAEIAALQQQLADIEKRLKAVETGANAKR